MAKLKAKRSLRTKKVKARKDVDAKRRRKPAVVKGNGARAAARPESDDDTVEAHGGPPLIEAGSDRSSVRSAATELTWSQFDREVQRLARDAARRFKPDAVVGLVHGGVFVGGAIASALKADFFPVRVSRRSRDTGQRLAIAEEMPKELAGRRVLLVDDVAASGDSLEMAARLARSAGASKVATATLVTRPDGYTPDFTSFTTKTFFVFPWDYQAVTEDARFEPEPPRR